MLRGWFDAFRSDGGPTLYSDTNRTAVIEDLRNILVYVTFSTLFVAFLLIFPGIRKERLSTLVCVTTSLFIGAVLLLSNFGTDWHIASTSISSSYRSFSKEILHADVAVRIGLNSVNVTLKASPIVKHSDEIDYNEKFTWIEASQMKTEYREALEKGLPFPILTIAEYFSHDIEGFSWGTKYRKAGYYTCIILWWAFAAWLLTNILLCMVPRYGAYSMLLTGVLMLSACGLYTFMLPKHPSLVIRFESHRSLNFSYGWCYWTVFAAGILGAIVGGAVSLVDAFFPNKISTIFEVDYDTPYRYFVGGQDGMAATPVLHTIPSRVPSKGKHLPLSSSSQLIGSSVSSTPESQNGGKCSSSPLGGLDNVAFDEDEDERGSTIVDGKRAVSLRHFGKFAQREAGRPHFGSLQKKIHSLSARSFTPRSGHVNISLPSTSIW